MKKTVVILQPQTGNRERKEQWNIATGQAAVPNRDIFGTSKRDKEHTVPVNFTLIIYTDSHGSTTTSKKVYNIYLTAESLILAQDER